MIMTSAMCMYGYHYIVPFVFLCALSLLGDTEAVSRFRMVRKETGEVVWFPLNVELFTTQNQNKSCGFKTDCPLDYDISDIDKMAKSQRIKNQKVKDALEEAHKQARAACISQQSPGFVDDDHGGWCYLGTESTVHAGNGSDVDYALPHGHVETDPGFVAGVAKALTKEDGKCCASLTDLGAGVGQLGHALRAQFPNIEYYGYDGAGNVEDFTKNYVHFIDLTQPLHLKRTDWVLSSEVGEHIPHAFEKQVIANLHAHNCNGVILSWAMLNQTGKSHINNHSNEYLIHIFNKLGYRLNAKSTQALRDSVNGRSWWLRKSAMVFDRIVKPADCN